MENFYRIVEKLKNAKSVAIFTHLNPDGDAIGSVFATKAILEQYGIEANIYLEKTMPEKFSYLNTGYKIGNPDAALDEDCALALDCGAPARLGTLAPLFKTAPLLLCIDHHRSNTSFCDISYIVPEAAATCELIYTLSKEFSKNIPYEAMQGIYTGISTDTGHFKYSNTSEKTLKIAAELIEKGLDFRKITSVIYDTTKLSKLKFMGAVAERIKIYNDKISVLDARREFLDEFNLSYEDLEELPNIVSNIEGMLVGILIKSGETEDSLKLSFRGRDLLDLSLLASHFGGGGHKNAAACVVYEPIDVIIPKIVEKINEMLKE